MTVDCRSAPALSLPLPLSESPSTINLRSMPYLVILDSALRWAGLGDGSRHGTSRWLRVPLPDGGLRPAPPVGTRSRGPRRRCPRGGVAPCPDPRSSGHRRFRPHRRHRGAARRGAEGRCRPGDLCSGAQHGAARPAARPRGGHRGDRSLYRRQRGGLLGLPRLPSRLPRRLRGPRECGDRGGDRARCPVPDSRPSSGAHKGRDHSSRRCARHRLRSHPLVLRPHP